MPTDIWKIPLDNDGCVRGSYYLRHKTDISDTLGVVHFVNGRSVEPVTGQQLMHFVSVLGADVDLEPADQEAAAALGGRGVKTPEPVVTAVALPPALEPGPEPDEPLPAQPPAPALERATDHKNKPGKR